MKAGTLLKVKRAKTKVVKPPPARRDMSKEVEAFALQCKELRVYDKLAERFVRIHGVSPPESVIEYVRTKGATAARFEAMYFFRRWFGWSYPQIGKLFARDPSTAINAVDAVTEMKSKGELPEPEFFVPEWARKVKIAVKGVTR